MLGTLSPTGTFCSSFPRAPAGIWGLWEFPAQPQEFPGVPNREHSHSWHCSISRESLISVLGFRSGNPEYTVSGNASNNISVKHPIVGFIEPFPWTPGCSFQGAAPAPCSRLQRDDPSLNSLGFPRVQPEFPSPAPPSLLHPREGKAREF